MLVLLLQLANIGKCLTSAFDFSTIFIFGVCKLIVHILHLFNQRVTVNFHALLLLFKAL